MSEKHERISQRRYFYAFVDLEVPDGQMPVTYVIPSEVVSEVVRQSHKTWLNTPGLGGREHRDNPVRRVRPAYGFPVPGFPAGWMEQYRERWELLRTAVE